MPNPPGVNATPTPHKISANPTKEFFVRMITRDIALQDCIFDLLDNSIDGARRSTQANRGHAELAGFRVDIDFTPTSFHIRDNCGGIALSDAIDYAFRFGRVPDKRDDVRGGIGLYGIGMKRAIFKMGRIAKVLSETPKECFAIALDVDDWVKRDVWDFEYSLEEAAGTPGTSIAIHELYPGIAEMFRDASFARELVNSIARDYAFFIARGLEVTVCGNLVPNRKYELQSGKELAPAVMQYDDLGVQVRLVAGLIERLPDDIPDDIKPERVHRSGWYVACNDRVVLAADKSDRTVWGDDGFNSWHPQYNGFAGFALFSAGDQTLLPWTTTKRDLDSSHAVYRRAVVKMKEMTRSFIDYSNARKVDQDAAKAAEVVETTVDISTLTNNQSSVLPKLPASSKRRTVTISYPKPIDEIEEIRDHIGDVTLSARDVGKYTYAYFRKVEMGK